MTRMKKCLAAALAAAALVGASTLAHAFSSDEGPTPDQPGRAPASMSFVSAPPVRVVAASERVRAAPGVQLWLTREGGHWSVPTGVDRFGVADGSLDMGGPGVSHWSETVNGRYFHSGVYRGAGDVARVEVVTERDTVSGAIVRLAGKPGWGVWYATSKLPDTSRSTPKHDFVRGVTVYDSSGKIIAKTVIRP